MFGVTTTTLIWVIAPLLLAAYYSDYLYGIWESDSLADEAYESLQDKITDGPEGALASTTYGDVRGKVLKTPNGYEFYAFLDIPYAAPPVGKLRFQRPLPPKSWTGVLDATENRKICWNMMPLKPKLENDPRENEDCLYLNVYVPKNPSNKDLLPVIFYITGGIYMFNDGTLKSYKPYNFVERDIIMVSINFRQGPLGFLTTNDGVIPGNLALWDQNMALRWVQGNIGKFGGDPSKVTINGHSSGASCAAFHMLSKHSKGLFRGVIAQSSAAISQDDVQKDPKYHAYKFANTINAKITPQNTSEELLAFLLSVPASTISNTTKINPDPEHNTKSFMNEPYELVWIPVVESTEDENAFLSGSIYENFRDGKFNHVSVLTGITSEEGGIKGALKPEVAKLVDDHPELLYRRATGVKEENKRTLGQKMKEIYTKEPLHKNLTAFIKLASDIRFGNGVMKFADVVSNHVDVYFYQFSYFGYMNEIPGCFECANIKMEGLGKAPHCTELPYLVWYKLEEDTRTYPESDIRMRRIISDLFGNFIKYLNPTPKRDPQLQNIIWPKFDSERLLYLDIDHNLTVKENPRCYRQIRGLF